ncbi:hypothetical protein [Pseudomonas sp.]|uniref:hypothetical protein n=1 Tax=Pseudomonas sp. TaxID=306 RepID=UPI00260D5B7A|nr:hypothetical protein [Pseudomonas sp.]
MKKYSLKQEASTSFEIEVINGSIYIDTTDIELPVKVERMFNTIDEAQKKMEKEEKVIKALKLDKAEADERLLDVMIDFINSTYESIDHLFGKGSTDKIFRVKSITGVFEFLEGLEPLLKEFKVISDKNLEERLIASKGKYKPVEVDTSGIEEIE